MYPTSRVAHVASVGHGLGMDGRDALLAWFDERARDLPWRRTRDPYAIWVSEVMLQQTRVETVIPYFERFLARFPTLADLAAAEEQAVLAAFSGLGYYRRARLLHRGAREAHARHGEVPRDRAARRALPGIGDYTAGAIGSIAFGLQEPIVDGNVVRVLSRVHRIEAEHGPAKVRKVLWSLAGQWAVGERPGDLNQALMELGATVCVPRAPRCDGCPLAPHCAVAGTALAAELPRLPARKEKAVVALRAAVVRDATGRLGLVRQEGALYGGMHGCVTVEGTAATRIAGLRAALEATFPGAVLEPTPCATLEHVLTHRTLRVRVHRAVGSGVLDAGRAGFYDAAGLETVGLSTLTRRLVEAGADDAAQARASRPAPGSRASGRRRAEASSSEGPTPAPPSSPTPRRSPARRA